MAQAPSIDRLLVLAADHPQAVIEQLQDNPDLASKQDAHGYSLLHAAASWNHPQLVRILIQEYKVNPNIKDEDAETALFSAETVDMAKDLLSFGVDPTLRNTEGQTAAEKLDDEDEQPLVAAFLREVAAHNGSAGAATSVISQTGGVEASPAARSGTHEDSSAEVHPAPPLPNGVHINVGTMHADEVGVEPDPEFRRRIEELAARDDFQTDEGQRELRRLVQDAVSGLAGEGQGLATRRRLD